MARDVTLRATFQELVGDETYEFWLQHEDDEWELNQAGDVELTMGHQDYLIPGLIAGDNYAAQVRLKRAGRYRVGYLTSNPDSWPAQSRCDFVPGALVGVGAPVINSATWSRTAVDSQKIAVNVTPDDINVDVAIFRDGVEIAVVPAPLASPFTYDDVDPPIATEYTYTAFHKTTGGLYGPISNSVDTYSGPPAIAGFVQTSAVDNYGTYEVNWTDDGRTYQLQDDYLCVGTTYAFQVGGEAGFVTGPHEVGKEIEVIPEGATQAISFHCRMRPKVTAFTVEDFGPWTEITIDMEIDDPDDNTNFNTCP